ncbi:MAG: glycosyltransferase family 39 protein [Nanoarchaeota archaeon]
MKNSTKFLITFFVILVLVKILLALFIPMSTAFSDDHQYLKMARSFFFDQNFEAYNIKGVQLPPLYPILISITHIFNNSIYVYFTIKVINVLLSSLIIIPAYLLAKEFLSEKNSRIFTFIVALLPFGFSYNSYILTENLFYSLFLFSIYFIYRCLIYNKKLDVILAGLFVGLALLTRLHGAILLATLGILFIIDLFKKRINYKLILIALIAATIYLPWFIRNLIVFSNLPQVHSANIYSWEVSNAFLRDSIFHSVYPLIIWLTTYSGALILSSLIIFPLYLFYKSKDNKLNKLKSLSFISIIMTLLIAANHHLRADNYFYKINDWIFFSGKLIGRYIDFVIPLIILIGFIGLIHYKTSLNNNNRKILNVSLLLAIIISSVHFISRSLFLPNNPSLTWIGLIKQGIDYIFYSKSLFYVNNTVLPSVSLASLIIIPLLLIILFILISKLFVKLKLSKVFLILALFLILLNITNVCVSSYNAKSWYETPQVKLSLWLNEHDKDKSSVILIDDRYGGSLKKDNQTMLYIKTDISAYTVLGYWLNREIIIGNINDLERINYVITRDDKLNLDLIKKSENGIYLYKVN